MSILDKTTNLELTQYGGSPVKAQLYANYNSDMQKIDAGYAELKGEIDGTNGLGERVSALETSITTIDGKADDAVATANDAKSTADGMDARVTAVEGDVSDLKTWKNDTVDPTLSAYDSRLDAIELVIETVSTANINDLIARMDALEQKVDANTQAIDTLNDNLISAVDRIEDLESGLGTTNANLNALSNRVSVLEDCCTSVRETLADHNTRINKNASDISALDARLTRDETNIAGNASDITILATQNNTQAGQIDDLYSKYNSLDPSSPTNLYARVQTLEDTVGNEPLQTVAQTVTGAINELFGHATDVDADEVDYDNTNSGLVATDVQGAIDEVVGTIGTEDARIEALETTVGGAGSGLVKDVSDNASAIGTLETTVGDNNSGLVKDVADLQTVVGDNSAGMVKDVADLQSTVGDSSAGLVKNVSDNTSAIGDLSLLSTADKTDLVSAINEVDGKTDVYSTSEVKTDKVWTDNKPIYRVVYNFTTPSTSGTTSMNFSVPEMATMDSITYIGGTIMINATSQATRPINYYMGASDHSCPSLERNSNMVTFYFADRTFLQGATCKLILEYTKT